MKKPYQKPAVLIESFELSQSIAACYFKLNHEASDNCKTVGQTNYNGDYIAEGGFLNKEVCDYELQAYCWTNGSGMFATYLSQN